MTEEESSPAERLRRIRRQHDLTQRRLATKLGVASSTIANWETGLVPISEQSIRKISTYFGVSPDWLRDGTGNPIDVPKSSAEWPTEPLKETWGVNAVLPPDWPIGFQEYITLSVQFGLDPKESTFRAMVQKAQELGTQTPLPIALSEPDSPRKRQLADWILLGTDVVLDGVEDLHRKALRK